jgi:hypothetical protein
VVTGCLISSGIEFANSLKPYSDIFNQAGQCLFLCLRNQSDYYVVQVPCMRPAQRKPISYTHKEKDRGFERVPGGEKYAPLTTKETAFESDNAIWHRIRETYFSDKGKWKKWLPFYGPTTVREVEVRIKPTIKISVADFILYSFNSLG